MEDTERHYSPYGYVSFYVVHHSLYMPNVPSYYKWFISVFGFLLAVYVPGGCYDYLTLSGREHIGRLTKKGTERDTLSHIQVPYWQWWSVPFLRWSIFLVNEHGLMSITAYWMTVIHIPFTQLNVTSIGLGYYMILIFPVPIMRLLQPSL